MSGQFGLLKQKRFAPFFGTQFLGAFNDNLFKNALVVLLTFQAASWTTIKPELLANLAAGIFILPFFLFSATAGQLADKYDKATLARLVKVLEMVIMGVAATGFFLHSLPVLMAALFLLIPGAALAVFTLVLRRWQRRAARSPRCSRPPTPPSAIRTWCAS